MKINNIKRKCYVCGLHFYEFSDFAEDGHEEGAEDLACNECAQDDELW